jgi:hypothetical protein
MVYKRIPTLQSGVRDPFLPSPRELLEFSAHPFVTFVHLQYQAAGHRAITSKEGPELGYLAMCFVLHKTTSEL